MFFFFLFLLVKQTENINFLCLNFSMRTCQYFARGTLHPSCRSMRTCCRLSPWDLEEKLWPAWLMLVTWPWQPSPKGSCMVIGVSHKFSANLFSNLKFKFIFLVINGVFFFFFVLKFWWTLFLFRVSYRDGVMEHEPKPCAAVKGTQIMVWRRPFVLMWKLMNVSYNFDFLFSWL